MTKLLAGLPRSMSLIAGGGKVPVEVCLSHGCDEDVYGINPLAPELFFFILAHPVYKM